MRSGAWAARSTSALNRSSEVGSAQCRSSKASTTGCDRAPAINKAVIAASCRRRNSSGANAVLRQRDVEQRREQGRIFGRVEADQPQSVLEIGEFLPVGRVGAAVAQPSPFGERVQGRVLQELRGGPFDPGVRRLGEFCAELLDEARLADAGLADDLDELAFAFQRARPATLKLVKFILPPDQRRQNPRAAAPAAARPHDAIERNRRRHALEVVRALVFGDEQPGRLPLHVRGDEHRPRFGRRLNARGDIGRLAENFAGRVDHDRPHVEADARRKLGRAGLRVAGVEVGERALDGERRPHRPLGVVLLRVRIAEQGHQTVAELLQHMAAETRHRGGGLVEVGPDEIAPVLGVEPRRKACRADEVAEHHGDRTPLGHKLVTLGRNGLMRERGSVRRLRGGKSSDCVEQPSSVADRSDANVLEVVRRQPRQHVRVDLVLSKFLLVLTEAETAKPHTDIHGRPPQFPWIITEVMKHV